MNCCGRQRAAISGQGAGAMKGGAPVRLSYAGVRPIVVRGAATGRLYRFAPGSSVPVQRSDAPSMRAIPALREVDITP
jgi:hypothetical protein